MAQRTSLVECVSLGRGGTDVGSTEAPGQGGRNPGRRPQALDAISPHRPGRQELTDELAARLPAHEFAGAWAYGQGQDVGHLLQELLLEFAESAESGVRRWREFSDCGHSLLGRPCLPYSWPAAVSCSSRSSASSPRSMNTFGRCRSAISLPRGRAKNRSRNWTCCSSASRDRSRQESEAVVKGGRSGKARAYQLWIAFPASLAQACHIAPKGCGFRNPSVHTPGTRTWSRRRQLGRPALRLRRLCLPLPNRRPRFALSQMVAPQHQVASKRIMMAEGARQPVEPGEQLAPRPQVADAGNGGGVKPALVDGQPAQVSISATPGSAHSSQRRTPRVESHGAWGKGRPARYAPLNWPRW